MPERDHFHPSQDAQDTLDSIERHFGWTEPKRSFRYAPSPDQVLPEEAITEEARRAATRFILGLLQAAVPVEEEPTVLLTPDEVKGRHALHTSHQSSGANATFTLREAWGAAE